MWFNARSSRPGVFFRPAAAERPLVDRQRGSWVLYAESGFLFGCKRSPGRFQEEIHAIWRSLLAGDGYELNRLQAGSCLPADSSQLDRELA